MAANHDFSNPVLQARIERVDASGSLTVIPLWTNSVGSPLKIDDRGNFTKENKLNFALPIVTDITIELSVGFIPQISVSTTLGYHELMQLLESDQITWGQDAIAVQFGYTMGNRAQLSPPYKGLLTNPEVRIGASDSSITFTGAGYKGFSLIRQGRSGQDYNNWTRRDIIDSLIVQPLDNLRVPMKFDDSEVKNLGAGDQSYDAMFTEKISLSPSWKADWHLILRMVQDANCWLFFDGENAKLIPINRRMVAPPKYKFALFPQPYGSGFGFNQAMQVYPILSFSSPYTAFLFPAGVVGSVSRNINSGLGELQQTAHHNLADSSDKNGGVSPNLQGSGMGPPQRGNTGSKGDEKTGSFLDPNFYDQLDAPAERRITSDFQTSIQNLGIEIEIETVGVPEILPGETFSLAGVSSKFCGTPNSPINYTVYKVVHTLGSGGFSTKITANCNSGWSTSEASRAGQLGNAKHDENSGDSDTKQPGSAT